MWRIRRRSLPGLLALGALLLAATVACSDSDTAGEGGGAAEPAPSAASSSTAPPTATPVPAPRDRDCYALDYDQAVSPTNDAEPVDCRRRHTSTTIAVGPLDAVVDGHLLAVDSARVQARVAEVCPQRLARFLGGTLEERRLSMLRSVWFTPTVEESDAGASWYRCDLIALAADQRLAPLPGGLAGVLDRPEGERYGMCGTTAPGERGFTRVICSAGHSWRAIATVPFPEGRYPGASVVRERGQQQCIDAARAVADDSLDFQWGYEWPTAAQWRAGQRYGRCWAPD